MEEKIEIQGLQLSQSDIEEISELISRYPNYSRYKLSRQLCEEWNWRSENGQLKDMASRSLLNKLEIKGYIKLPPKREKHPNLKRMKDKSNRISLLPRLSQVEKLEEALPLEIEMLKSRSYSMELFSTLLARNHYLGYKGSVGEHIGYLVWDRNGDPLSCVLFGAAAWKVSSRDKYIGWQEEERRANLKKIVNNHRFLLLRRVPNLASYILSRICRRIGEDFINKYGHKIVLLETFVEKERFIGTCYQASNWENVGETIGRSRNDRHNKLKVPIKQIYVYPLEKRFREELKDKG
jgi:hypothetical protein